MRARDTVAHGRERPETIVRSVKEHVGGGLQMGPETKLTDSD